MKIKVAKETVKNLRDNVAAFNTGKNSVRFSIGLKNAGKGLACQACIVKDGQQMVIGFLTSGIPSEWEEGKGQNFAVKAGVFCDYIGKLLPFDADFNFDITDKGIKVSLPGTATVTLPLVAEGDCEPLIPSDEGDAYIAVEKMKSTDLLTVLKKGGYNARTGEDIRNITNHVAFAFANGNMMVMSADGSRIAKAVKPASIKYNELMNALLYFEPDARPSYVAKVQKNEITADDYFKEAAAKGYRPNVAGVSLPTSAVITLLKLSGMGEEVNIMITPRNMHLVTGNLKLCFSLGVANWTTYANFAGNFDKLAWTKVVVDKEALSNAFSICELACQGKKLPVSVEFTDTGIVLKDCSGNKVKVGYVESMEGIAGKTAHLNCTLLIETLSKFAGGNIVIGCIGGKQDPVLIADGTMEGENNVSKTYVLQIMVSDKKEDEKKETDKKAKKGKKSDAVEDASSEEDIAKMARDEEEEVEETVIEESEIEEETEEEVSEDELPEEEQL